MVKFVPSSSTNPCAAEPSTGMLTKYLYQTGVNPTWIAPIISIPFSSGLYAICYLWGSLSGPTWVRVPVVKLSDAAPFSDIVETRDVISVVESNLFFSQVSSSVVVVEDHFSVPSLSAASVSRADSCDAARLIPSNTLCQNLSTTTARNTNSPDTHTLLVEPIDTSFSGSSSSFSSVKLPDLDVDWPPSGTYPLKLCYKKQVSSGRVNRGLWVVVPGVGGNQVYLTPATPSSIKITGGSLLDDGNSTDIGSEFTVQLQVVGENGEAVRGNKFIAILGMEEAGMGIQTASSGCASGQTASEFGGRYGNSNSIKWLCLRTNRLRIRMACQQYYLQNKL
eukprot:TRINITY_DN16614_c0_g1_i1.p1 TRINITY_DN16614_c0_g1~~TRINITY_DN16614_c0_g1_i1.p1  ORF type:complete len:381 (+),score=55.40 TRINITY_DN16614_c0_g1_i1:136-1143(+)